MGYTRHPSCNPPGTDDPDKIWRYMDFTQLVSLLENDELYFPRADSLEDPFEGSLPVSHKNNVREEIFNEKSVNWAVQHLPKFRKICRKFTFLSCWHMNRGESAAMWDIYLKSNQGICIQSTIDDLIEGLNTEYNVYLSKVKYIDYTDAKIPGWTGLGDTISPFIYKRESFKHESEVRAIIHELPWHYSDEGGKITSEDIGDEDLEEGDYESGKTVDVDLDRLINSIRVSPQAQPWVAELTEDVCETYGLGADFVVDSPMEREPYH
ncbi:DUF2971 domain-containing protein [Halorarum salinum]|uniref:DUF2971 domain-containing protein n=1 Tax=Halorarum salinum TaxID=2743089 RepID=A0A7D5QA11_9EURY|nr:DUF2971 domain-containing protein [Halobaculum salinum]QLG62216.1 DUF2971 domain-containing protein [Halobaculum salinum]